MPRLASYTTFPSTPTVPPSTGGSTGGGTSYTASAPVTLSGTAFGLGYDANTLAVSAGKLGIAQSVMASIAAGQNTPVVDSGGNYVGPSQASFDTLQARVTEVEETDQELTTRVTTVEGIANQNQTTVGQHATKLTTIDGQIASLNSADNAQVGRLNGIDTALAALTPRVTGVETTNGVQSTDIVSLKDRATALENNKQAKHANLTSLSQATPTLPALQMQGNLNVTTVNGAAYPPASSGGGLRKVQYWYQNVVCSGNASPTKAIPEPGSGYYHAVVNVATTVTCGAGGVQAIALFGAATQFSPQYEVARYLFNLPAGKYQIAFQLYVPNLIGSSGTNHFLTGDNCSWSGDNLTVTIDWMSA